jgi:hypothetical protein
MYRSSLVITPAGTMAYEAAFHHIPSIIFANEFYGVLPTVYKCNSIEDLPRLIYDLVTRPLDKNDEPLVEYLANLFANTFVGRNTSYFGAHSDNELICMQDAYDRLFAVLKQNLKKCSIPLVD